MSDCPIEVQARAALAVTEGLAARADEGPADTDERESRRVEFLRVRAHVERLARRDTRSRPDEIEALLRIAKVPAEEFAAACAEQDRRDALAMDDAEALIEAMKKPAPIPVTTRGRTCGAAMRGRCTRFGPVTRSGEPIWRSCR